MERRRRIGRALFAVVMDIGATLNARFISRPAHSWNLYVN
jgi:hypothetical protein